MQTVLARASFVTLHNGVPFTVRKGVTALPVNHPIVLRFPEVFNVTVEQATAAPNELRNVRRPSRKKAK